MQELTSQALGQVFGGLEGQCCPEKQTILTNPTATRPIETAYQRFEREQGGGPYVPGGAWYFGSAPRASEQAHAWGGIQKLASLFTRS